MTQDHEKLRGTASASCKGFSVLFLTNCLIIRYLRKLKVIAPGGLRSQASFPTTPIDRVGTMGVAAKPTSSRPYYRNTLIREERTIISMVSIHYGASLSGNLFRYCMGRILAQTLGYKLDAEHIPGFPRTNESVDGSVYVAPEILLDGFQLRHAFLNSPVRQWPPINLRGHIVLNGSYHDARYFAPFTDAIRTNWLHPLHCVDVTTGKLAYHVSFNGRNKDIQPGFSWAESHVSAFRPKQILILSTEWHPSLDVLQAQLSRFSFTDVCVADEATLIRTASDAEYIITSPGPLQWWVAMLSKAVRVHSFRVGRPSG